MARLPQREIRMRLVVERPAPGVANSLQDKKGRPVGAKVAAQAPLVFDFPLRIAEGPKFYGEQVRAEGAERRFVYIAIGKQAGDCASEWSRRMKIDIHVIPQALLDGTIAGRRLVGVVDGTGKDGTPACATVPVGGWHRD